MSGDKAALAAWSDSANWHYHMFYYARSDPRVWVPKRQRLFGMSTGATLNFAHTESWAFMTAVAAVCAWGLWGAVRARR